MADSDLDDWNSDVSSGSDQEDILMDDDASQSGDGELTFT